MSVGSRCPSSCVRAGDPASAGSSSAHAGLASRAARTAACVALAAVAVFVAGCGGNNRPTGKRPAAAGPTPTAAERRAIHDGLERIGRACDAKAQRAQRARIASSEVRRLLAFRRRYPTQRFALERGGETGTMLSVLLVARSELVGCYPAGVYAIDRVLPPSVRRALPSARGTPTG